MNSRSLQPFLASATVLVFLVTMFFNFSATQPQMGIFNQPTANVSHKYPVQITPAGWTFALWGIIYTYMTIGLLYGISQFFRVAPGSSSSALYCSPATLSVWFWLLMSLDLALNTGWLLLWDRELLTASAVVLWLVAAINWLIMLLLHRDVIEARDAWRGSGGEAGGREVRLLVGCVLNGLAVYTTWTTIAALLNTDIALVHVAMLSDSTCSTVVVAVLCLSVAVYCLLDCTLLDKYTRWTITPYLTLVWAASGIFSKNYSTSVTAANSSVGVAIVCLLAEVCVLLVAKLLLLAWYHRTRYWWQQHSPRQTGSAVLPL